MSPQCGTLDIPTHTKRFTTTWLRAQAGVVAGLGKGFQVELQVPFDVRVLDVDRTLDGAPYPGTYVDLHHRDEALVGLSDGLARAWWLARPAPGASIGVSLGSSIPFGRPEPDPFEAERAEVWHRHTQLGMGTWVPVVGVLAAGAKDGFGGFGTVEARLPVAESRLGYRPPFVVNASAGPLFQASPAVQVLVTGDVSWASPERWSGVPSDGLVVVGAAGTVLGRVAPDVVLQGTVRATVWQQEVLRREEVMRQHLLVGLGVSWTLDLRPHDDAATP